MVGSGAPIRNISSHLSKVLVDIVGPPSELTPEKIEELRVAREYRLQKCRRALAAAAPMGLALRIVDRVCIEQAPLAGPAAIQAPLKHLRAGLSALVDALDLDSKTRQPSAAPSSQFEATAAEPDPHPCRARKARLETRFNPDFAGRAGSRGGPQGHPPIEDARHPRRQLPRSTVEGLRGKKDGIGQGVGVADR